VANANVGDRHAIGSPPRNNSLSEAACRRSIFIGADLMEIGNSFVLGAEELRQSHPDPWTCAPTFSRTISSIERNFVLEVVSSFV
jgi:hypothetical protein